MAGADIIIMIFLLGYLAYALLATFVTVGWLGKITIILVAIPSVYYGYKGIIFYLEGKKEQDKLAKQCPSCQEIDALEMVGEHIKNKQRKFAGYTMETVNAKQIRRQRHVTTEFITQKWQCRSCNHILERSRNEKYDS